MDRSEVLLTIIIPAYNAEKYILPCLKSLKGLFQDELEILVINDGSQDQTEKITNEYIKNDPRIRLLNVQNGGVSKARNIGIEHAIGKYIMFLDSDDYLLSDVFDEIERITREEIYDFAAFSRDIIEEDGRIRTESFGFSAKETEDKSTIDGIMYADSLLNECWGKLYKSSVIKEHNIRFPVGVPIGEDLMFVMEYYSYCEKFYASNKSLVAYRQHGGSAMKKYGVTGRLKYTQDLYAFSKKYIPENMVEDSLFYNFKVLTNLCREYSRDGLNPDAIKAIYTSDMSKEIMDSINSKRVPMYRKHEYIFMKHGLVMISSLYYYLKAKAD